MPEALNRWIARVALRREQFSIAQIDLRREYLLTVSLLRLHYPQRLIQLDLTEFRIPHHFTALIGLLQQLFAIL